MKLPEPIAFLEPFLFGLKADADNAVLTFKAHKNEIDISLVENEVITKSFINVEIEYLRVEKMPPYCGPTYYGDVIGYVVTITMTKAMLVAYSSINT
jgi:hypothetical protein